MVATLFPVWVPCNSILPLELRPNLVLPAVSNEIVLSAGKDILVSASPLCWISCATLIDAGVFIASTIPLNVETPAMLTLSKFVCPSTSKSPFISAPVATTVPVIRTPVLRVLNFSPPLW